MNKAICLSPLNLSTIFVLLLSLPIYLYGQDKLKVGEIVAKHVASIGTPDAIAAAANRKIEGTAKARRIQNNFLTAEGKSLLASTKDLFLLLMAFDTTSDDAYKLERISFDGKKINIPFVTESSRSAIGSFVYDYPEIAKQGLLGGPLFSSCGHAFPHEGQERWLTFGRRRLDKVISLMQPGDKNFYRTQISFEEFPELKYPALQ